VAGDKERQGRKSEKEIRVGGMGGGGNEGVGGKCAWGWEELDERR